MSVISVSLKFKWTVNDQIRNYLDFYDKKTAWNFHIRNVQKNYVKYYLIKLINDNYQQRKTDTCLPPVKDPANDKNTDQNLAQISTVTLSFKKTDIVF